MGQTFAVTGKGGVGKTTCAALIVQWLQASSMTPVLAVDADSNANLHELLGVSYAATVGGIRESARKEFQGLSGMAKQEFLNLRIQEALVEERGYDLIVMGRPEGQGCYCFANNVLRDVIQRLAANYQHVVVDSEAGLEHVSRRTLLRLDFLFIVSDCSVRGVRTARRIADLADEMGTPVRHRGLIVNRAPQGVLPPLIRAEAEATGLSLWSVIPDDPHVATMDAGGRTVLDIPESSAARAAIGALMKDLLAAEGTRSMSIAPILRLPAGETPVLPRRDG
jgi:CO dehydrogenase maturation factor